MEEIKKLQKVYFAIIDDFINHTQTGYTKSEFHALIKSNILPMLYDNDEYWDTDKFDINTSYNNMSTRWLTYSGWEEFIKNVKSFLPTFLKDIIK